MPLERLRAEQREDALDAIDEALASIEENAREPTKWEKIFLMAALCCFQAGNYVLAEAEADLAVLSPSEKRSMLEIINGVAIEDVTRGALKSALTASRTQLDSDRTGPLFRA